jgi:type IV pilus assembly protein PilY1
MGRRAAVLLLGAWQAAAAMPALDLASAADHARAGACVAVGLEAGGAFLYQATASIDGLQGSLAKYALIRDGQERPAVPAQPLWNAATLLDARDPASRAIYTGQRDGDRLRTIPLDWAALDQAQRQLLASGLDGAGDTLGPRRLAYLRGERLLEAGQPGGLFRSRQGVLGATVVGVPLHVPAPAAGSADPRYAAYAAASGRRAAAVYLQANDGMLHAFDAGSGNELFAYMPAALQAQWPRLSSPAHAASPYAEGALAAGEALVNGAWKAVLVGAMGGGAQGVFALDISDPARFTAGDGALFEFTAADDPDIGNVFNAAAVARFRIDAAQYGDFVVVASGYNNKRSDGAGRSGPAGTGVLFLLSLDKAPAVAWQLNRNYFKFALPAASDALANGLAQPALIPDADDSVRYAYAGDLQGQLWRLDFGAGLPPWPKATGAGIPLFAASDAGGKRQPITTPPRAVYAGNGLLLLFGTGKLLERSDAQDKSFQAFYAVSDQIDAQRSATRADLAVRTLVPDSAGGYRLDGDAVSAKGWLLDFPIAGERMLASPVALDGKLYFTTMLPGAAACTPGGGLYLLDALSGQSPSGISAPWLAMPAPPGRAIAIVSDSQPGQSGGAGGSEVQTRDTVVSGGAMASGGAGKPAPAMLQKSRSGRLGWREVVDWEGVRNAIRQK